MRCLTRDGGGPRHEHPTLMLSENVLQDIGHEDADHDPSEQNIASGQVPSLACATSLVWDILWSSPDHFPSSTLPANIFVHPAGRHRRLAGCIRDNIIRYEMYDQGHSSRTSYLWMSGAERTLFVTYRVEVRHWTSFCASFDNHFS